MIGMDARIDPATAFSISLGDAHIIRNTTGSARDALRSIISLNKSLDTTEILPINHADCRMLILKNGDPLAVVEKNLGTDARDEVVGLDFHPIRDLGRW